MSDDPLNRQAITAVDVDGTLGEILDLPEHLRDAVWRVQSANIRPTPTPGGLCVVGVDGLERGGDLARAALVPGLAAPLTVWAGRPDLTAAPQTVLLVSYSGNDAAVLEAFGATQRTQRVALTTGGELAAAARADSVPVVPLPGGFPEPRLAIGYPLVVCLELARLGGLVRSSSAMVEDAAAHVARLARGWGPDSPADSLVKRRAHATALNGTGTLWAPGPVDVGETPLQRVVTQVLLESLVQLYVKVLTAPAQP